MRRYGKGRDRANQFVARAEIWQVKLWQGQRYGNVENRAQVRAEKPEWGAGWRPVVGLRSGVKMLVAGGWWAGTVDGESAKNRAEEAEASAGTDTSAAIIVWTMAELMKHPTTMRKVQEELRTLIQGKTFIDESDLSKLPYLKAVVRETLRLRAAGPLLIVREAIQKCSIQGYDILPKSLVFVSIWEIGRDPNFWSDPEIFIPERFLGSSIDFRGQDFELIPFGAGKRICPGLLLGMANVELALANLLYTFDWKLPVGMTEDDIDFDVLPGITMHKKNPLCLLAKKFSLVN
ncbi:hypothetical protein Cgig2_012244 [Carnegiea gigantea]|uniref:Cytochrome P450 n=1 Tax=Carnegiea gigantea TaxID=171969 RepID=A0A9Q1GQF1_9CARY|nr:hypothetical protein Cgig2_012244 [Carnegiea gigantea]